MVVKAFGSLCSEGQPGPHATPGARGSGACSGSVPGGEEGLCVEPGERRMLAVTGGSSVSSPDLTAGLLEAKGHSLVAIPWMELTMSGGNPGPVCS